MEEAKKKLGLVRVVIVWIEMGILFVIGVFGLLTTMEVVECDFGYRIYYLVGLWQALRLSPSPAGTFS